MKFYGQLENACLEILSSDPASNVEGRIYYNSSTSNAMLDTGLAKKILISNPMTTANDLIIGGASGAATRLAAGSEKQVLTITGGNIGWGTMPTPMTTLGDVIVGGASGAAARLGVGANGQVLTADSTATDGLSYQNPANFRNRLVNGAFDYWQEKGSTVVGISNATSTYIADQWYVKNNSAGACQAQRVTASLDGSLYALSMAYEGSSTSNNLELYQILSNAASLALYNQTASFGIQIKAAGNINQVGIQFFYGTSESKTLSSIGAEVLTTVNSSTYTRCAINGQALGTSMTTSGVIAVRIRCTGASTGNIYDNANGLIATQAIVNLGPVAMPFSRQHADPAQELQSCQFFYEKSYDIGTSPATATLSGVNAWPCYGVDAGGDNVWTSVNFKVPKRTTPSVVLYDAGGNIGKCSTWVGANTRTDNTTSANPTNTNSNGFNSNIVVPHSATALGYQWIADARI